jgi:branched-chain amino acid transport system ATP-binding protein
VQRLLLAVRAAADRGVGVLLVEQHASEALSIADRVVVLRRGRVALEASAAELRANVGRLESAYLSGLDDAVATSGTAGTGGGENDGRA